MTYKTQIEKGCGRFYMPMTCGKEDKRYNIPFWLCPVCEAKLEGYNQARKELFCGECGFPKEWERNPAFLTDSVFSIISYEEDKCKECGHQSSGWAIKKIEPLLREFRKAGKEQARKEELEFLKSLDNLTPDRNNQVKERIKELSNG